MFFQFLFFFSNLSIAHFSEREIMFADIRYTEIVNLRHGETFRRADRGAQSAEATFSHIDIEGRGINTFGCPIRRFAYFLRCFDRFNVNAVDRADLGALIADNAVIDLVVKPVPAIVGHGLHFIWILNGRYALPLGEIICIGNGTYGLRSSGLEKVAQGNAKAVKQRAD
jgi:hypothetical protein